MPDRRAATRNGAIIGMVFGAVFLAAISLGTRRPLGFDIPRDPVILIPLGMLLGGVCGGLVFRRSVGG